MSGDDDWQGAFVRNWGFDGRFGRGYRADGLLRAWTRDDRKLEGRDMVADALIVLACDELPAAMLFALWMDGRPTEGRSHRT